MIVTLGTKVNVIIAMTETKANDIAFGGSRLKFWQSVFKPKRFQRNQNLFHINLTVVAKPVLARYLLLSYLFWAVSKGTSPLQIGPSSILVTRRSATWKHPISFDWKIEGQSCQHKIMFLTIKQNTINLWNFQSTFSMCCHMI